MANLTISIDDEALRKARIRALEEGTSINAILRDVLETYAGVNKSHLAALTALIKLSEQSTSARGESTISRESLYERK